MRRLISRAWRGVKDIIWHAKTFARTAELSGWQPASNEVSRFKDVTAGSPDAPSY